MVGAPQCIINSRSRRFELRIHIGNQMLDRLKASDHLAKLLARFGVAHTFIDAGLRQPDLLAGQGCGGAIEAAASLAGKEPT